MYQGARVQADISPAYVAFFDEAGDPGVKKIVPIDTIGASEWFVLACALVSTENELSLIQLVKDIRTRIRSSQGASLHYRKIPEHKKNLVVTAVANHNIRLFVLCSNKRNMRAYRNYKAEQFNLHQNDWFYNYCIRILLERVSDYVVSWEMKHRLPLNPIKLVFSKRGGHSYRHVKTYSELLSLQTKKGSLYQTARSPNFDVLDPNLIEAVQSECSAGCQIADVVASAFYQAVNTNGPHWTTHYAKQLKPRMARIGGEYENQGVTLLPWPGRNRRQLTAQQLEIFKYYDFKG